jgi:hypothetical protein
LPVNPEQDHVDEEVSEGLLMQASVRIEGCVENEMQQQKKNKGRSERSP